MGIHYNFGLSTAFPKNACVFCSKSIVDFKNKEKHMLSYSIIPCKRFKAHTIIVRMTVIENVFISSKTMHQLDASYFDKSIVQSSLY